MIKTIKGKVIAGTLVFGLVAGGGVAFGANDAGVQLKAWYDAQFGKSSSNVETTYTGYQKDKFEGFDQEVSGLKENATKSINKVGADAISTSNKKIDGQKTEHIDAIKKEKEAIEGYMAGQFKDLSDKAIVKINSAADTAWANADGAMLKHTDAEGAVARATVKKELEATTATAVSELKKAIDDAKTELQKQLDSKSGATVKVLTDLIDTKINKLSKDITNRTNKLIALQTIFITNEAADLEKVALKEMKDLVDAINK